MNARTAARIAAIKSQLVDIDEWLDKYRDRRTEAPNYSANQGRAHELRKELIKLRDPELYARVYA